MLFALLYYAVSGRKWFKGPRVNIEHIIYGEILEGQDGDCRGSDNERYSAKVQGKQG